MQNLKSLALKTACAFEVSFSHVIRDRATARNAFLMGMTMPVSCFTYSNFCVKSNCHFTPNLTSRGLKMFVWVVSMKIRF